MTEFHEQLHQLSRIQDYRDQVSSGLFQIHRILTTYFPEIDIVCVNQMNKLLNDNLQEILNKLSKEIEI